MRKKGQRVGLFHCLESGLKSYARGSHYRPSGLELHVSQCPECQQKLLVTAGKAAQLLQDERPTRKLFRVYQLLAAASVVPTVSQLRIISRRGTRRTRELQRRNALVRFMMDLVDLVDALNEERQLPGEQGGIYASSGVEEPQQDDAEGQFIEDGHVDRGSSCPDDVEVVEEGDPSPVLRAPLHVVTGDEEARTGYAEAVEDGDTVADTEEQVLAAQRSLQAQHGAGGEDPVRTQVKEERGVPVDPNVFLAGGDLSAAEEEPQQGGSPCVSEEALATNLENAGAPVAAITEEPGDGPESAKHDD